MLPVAALPGRQLRLDQPAGRLPKLAANADLSWGAVVGKRCETEAESALKTWLAKRLEA